MQILRLGSGRFRCRYRGLVPEASGADTEVGFQKVPVRIPRFGPEASGADTEVGFQKVPVRILRSGSGRFRSKCR